MLKGISNYKKTSYTFWGAQGRVLKTGMGIQSLRTPRPNQILSCGDPRITVSSHSYAHGIKDYEHFKGLNII